MEPLIILKSDKKCLFCGLKKNNQLKYGPLYKLGNIRAHYYCVLLSNRLIQNGKDNEGILGFLVSDIERELERTKSVLCIYCHKGNATIRCASSKCRKCFHLPCGLRNGSSHQFMYQFKSFCSVHRPVQNIPVRIFNEACKTKIICCICQENVNVRERHNNLWAPCCLKAWYHRNCIQKFAHSAGYFCRCAACNDSKTFNEWMQKFGIFIPQQDASWELVPNAFEELLFRYNKCDAEKCKCPDGRKSNTENTMWEIVLCQSCGSQGIHVACGNLKFVSPEWECPSCYQITKNINSSNGVVRGSCKASACSSEQLKLTEVCQKKRRRGSENFEKLDKRKRRRMDSEEDEIEIDVETVNEGEKSDETLPEAAASLEDVEEIRLGEKGDHESGQQKVLEIKPGPLSYKLRVIRKVWRDLLIPSEKEVGAKSTPSVTQLVQLSDSEERDSDVEVIEDVTKQTKEERVCDGATNEQMVVSGNEKGSEDLCSHGEGVPTTDCKSSKTDLREGKETERVIDDEVIVLTD